MSVFNSSSSGGSDGGGFFLGSGAATGAIASSGAASIAAMSSWNAIAWILFGVMTIFTCVMVHQIVMRQKRRRGGAR